MTSLAFIGVDWGTSNGRFWAGSMRTQGAVTSPPAGTLWRYDGGDSATAFIDDIRIPNSLAWSLDGNTMYFADSPTNTIWTYDFSDGTPRNRRVFAHTAPGVHPDGSCVDAEDHLWNAQWGAGEVVRYAPDGRVVQRLALPVSQPSCVAFGGPHLNWLMVTTARVDLTPEQLAQEPFAGALLVYDVGVRGVPEVVCRASG